MTGRDFSYAYFVFPLRYRTPDKQCGPGRYRGLTAFASLSMAVSEGAAGRRRALVLAASATSFRRADSCRSRTYRPHPAAEIRHRVS
ncbi:hypothetical protein [Thiolapillus sp.]|uniref:hypothetical protein n=1 Tax=Thiolapillus sp. TaxID=2017437 RepID=UPI003AF7EF1C